MLRICLTKCVWAGNSSSSGDIDSRYNRVEATPEARAELAKIENRLGDYVCRLCTLLFPDAFELARHRCAGIRTVEYRCPECDKCFNCPANLASHRRWHKPRNADGKLPSKAAQFRDNLLPSTPVPHGDHVNYSDAVTDHSSVDDSLSASIGGLYRCPTCRKLFRRKSYLRKHALGACPALHKLQRLSTQDHVPKSWLTMSAHKPTCHQNTLSSVRNLITSAASGSAEPSHHGVLFDDDKQQAHGSSQASGITGDDDALHDVTSAETVDEYQRFFKKKFSALMGGVKCTSDGSPKSSTPPSSPSYTSSSLNNVCHVMSNYRPIKDSLFDLCT
jgi:ssDNA-binding Zn-finger/Zn-ribbon topoisomerase 1